MRRIMKKLLLAIALILVSAAAAAQDWAKQRLEASPRHREWVKVKSGQRMVNAYVVYPEVKKKAPAVVVIHEIFGMSDWVQLLADAVGKAIRDLPPDQITADLNAAADYVAKLPAANGKVAVAGFCWGGTDTFRFATNRPSLAAAFVFYGSGPDSVDAIKAPVYGFYAGNDARIGATVPKTQERMKAAGKKYDVVTYEGAGHGFMRAGDAPAPPADADPKAREAYAGNKKARDDAWTRWKALLAKL